MGLRSRIHVLEIFEGFREIQILLWGFYSKDFTISGW